MKLFSACEGAGGICRLLDDVPIDKMVFGSYAPFYYFESAWLKMPAICDLS